MKSYNTQKYRSVISVKYAMRTWAYIVNAVFVGIVQNRNALQKNAIAA